MAKWIDCLDKLPAEDSAVLVADKNDGVTLAWITDGRWCHQLFVLRDVTHWMPLPAPPMRLSSLDELTEGLARGLAEGFKIDFETLDPDRKSRMLAHLKFVVSGLDKRKE